MLIKTRAVMNGREYFVHHEDNKIVNIFKDGVNLTASLRQSVKDRLLRLAIQIERWNVEDGKK